jgi:hypothetical protein
VQQQQQRQQRQQDMGRKGKGQRQRQWLRRIELPHDCCLDLCMACICTLVVLLSRILH